MTKDIEELTFELNNFIHSVINDFVNEEYAVVDIYKRIRITGHGFVVIVSVSEISIVARAYKDDIFENEYFLIEYLKKDKRLLTFGNYKPFLEEVHSIFIMDCLGVI